VIVASGSGKGPEVGLEQPRPADLDKEPDMTLVLALLLAVTFAVVVLAGLVISRAAAGHGLEDELAAGADREPWAEAAVLDERDRIAA
jgi:hypothetical protein